MAQALRKAAGDYPLWEAWWVINGFKRTTRYVNLNVQADDFWGILFTLPTPKKLTWLGGLAGTKGKLTVSASAAFYPQLRRPGIHGFQVHLAWPSGALLASRVRPVGLGPSSNKVNRTLVATWNCCGKAMARTQVRTS